MVMVVVVMVAMAEEETVMVVEVMAAMAEEETAMVAMAEDWRGVLLAVAVRAATRAAARAATRAARAAAAADCTHTMRRIAPTRRHTIRMWAGCL